MIQTIRSIRRIHVVGVLLALAVGATGGGPLGAQETEEELAATTPRTRWGFGARGGLFDMTNSPDAYDAVFGEPMPSVGAQLELDRLPRWRFAATLDYGQVEGERVLLTDPPRGTGVEEELRMIPLHVTAAWRLRPLSRWDWYLGAGPSLLDWENESSGASNGSTDAGASVVLGLRRQRVPDTLPGTIDVEAQPRGWRWGGELRWSTFPDALPDAGVSGFFGEDDPGGVTLTFVAMSPLGGRSRATTAGESSSAAR